MDQSSNIYKDNGYENRKDYLDYLAESHSVDRHTVYAMASMLGPNEDFDALVVELDDFFGE